MTKKLSPYATKYHRDGTVTVWDVYTQSWLRTDKPSDKVLASLGGDERARVLLHCAGVHLTVKFATICTVGYSGSVSRDQNLAAHGGVCHIQARRDGGLILARKVNSNGRHTEVGEAFAASCEQLLHWASVAKAST